MAEQPDFRISVLLPSRSRPGPLAESVASLRSSASQPARLEVLVAWDSDDPETEQVAAELGARTVCFSDRPGYHRLHRYVNRLAELSSGEWLLLWNDDARMLTDGWDDVIGEHAPSWPAVLSPSSTGMARSSCCFPIFSRALYRIINHCSLSPHIDTWLQDLANGAGIMRLIDVDILHDRFDLTGGHNDLRYSESRAGYRTSEFYAASTQYQLRVDIDRVLTWMRS